MTVTPLFVHVQFEPSDTAPTPASPVESVYMAYMTDEGLSTAKFEPDADQDGRDDSMWEKVAGYLNEFVRQVPNARIVGWDLRNRDWPAIVANVVKHGFKLNRSLLLPLDEKWNKAPLVDLKNLFVQGGFIEADKWPSLGTVYDMFTDDATGELGQESVVFACSQIYALYEHAFQ